MKPRFADRARPAKRLAALLMAACLPLELAANGPETEVGDFYSTGPASRDGIGRFYMGREISQVMGHLGAGWLERPTREREERTDLLLASLDLEPDDVVVDLGAGTGYFTLPIARRLTRGRALAVDLQPEMLAIIRERAAAEGLDNVELVHASAQDPGLAPDTVDWVLMVDAYHEFSRPREVMRAIFLALRPGGRVALVEYRAEDPAVPIKRLHKMSEAQARRELEAVGFAWIETRDVLPQQHLLLFEKPRDPGRRHRGEGVAE